MKKELSADEWIAQFREWIASHPQKAELFRLKTPAEIAMKRFQERKDLLRRFH